MIIPTLLAILVPLVFLYLISALDVRTRKRRRLLLLAFIWGMIVFVIVYVILTVLVNNHVFTLQQVVTIVAPILEEILKAAVLILFARRLHIRSAVDGGEYGFAVGIGFSILENLLYLSSAEPGTGLETALARVLSTNLMHGLATGIVGATIGSNHYRSRRVVQRRTILALIVAIAIHMIFNQIVLRAEGVSLVAISVVFGLTGVAVLIFIITIAMNAERDWINAQLKAEGVAAGERMAAANPALFAEMLARQKIGLDENQEKLLNDYVRLVGEKAILTRKIALNERSEFYEGLHKRDLEITRQIKDLNRQMGFYLRVIVRMILPSTEDDNWVVLGKELDIDDHLMKVMVSMGERQKMLSTSESRARRVALDECALFNSLESSELDDLALLLDQVVVKQGENIGEQGVYDGRLFIVATGKLVAKVTDVQGVETVVLVYVPGDTFGELSLIDLKPYPVTITALEDTLLYTLTRDDFITLIVARPQVNFRLLKELTQQIREQTEFITLVRYMGIENLPVELTKGRSQLPEGATQLPDISPARD